MKAALILFAHGARDTRWAAPFDALLGQVQALRPGTEVRLAYLELMSPSLPEAASMLVEQGCQAIAVQPLFLGTGGHLRRDLPVLMEGLRERFPSTRWTLETAIGEDPRVLDTMARVCAAAADRLI